ncbi:MAG: OsmC family protein [Pseudomonadota bacterium]
MVEHVVDVRWALGDADFAANTYSRAHEIVLDGGITVPGSASPHVVPPPRSVEAALDPEEAYVAALSACHMLWFLDLARQAGRVVERYDDHARGTMARRSDGTFWISKVVLDPKITWRGAAPEAEDLADLHHRAHENCFIANSVRTEVTVAGAA